MIIVTVRIGDGTGYLDAHVLQPAVAGHDLPQGDGARGLGGRAVLPGQPADGQPGGRGPPRRTRRAGAHRTDHPGASRRGRDRAANDPRAALPGVRAAGATARPPARGGGAAERLCAWDDRAPHDPFPCRRRRARRRPRAAEVRRALHAGARGRLPQAARRGRAQGRGAHAGGRAHATPPRDRPVHSDRGAGPRDAGGRGRDGGRATDEPAAAGRRRRRQDPRGVARVPGRDPVGAPGRDHGADRGARRPARAVGGGAPRRGRRRLRTWRSQRRRARDRPMPRSRCSAPGRRRTPPVTRQPRRTRTSARHLRDPHRLGHRQGPRAGPRRGSPRAPSTSSWARTRWCRRASRSATCRSRSSTSSTGSGCTSGWRSRARAVATSTC